MRAIRRLKYTKEELEQIHKELEDCIWAAIDVRRGVIAAGDEQLTELRDSLLMNRSKSNDIICTGIDLNTGEVYYASLINRCNPDVEGGNIPDYFRERINTLIRYFFEDIPAFQEEKKRPRYSKKPSTLAFN